MNKLEGDSTSNIKALKLTDSTIGDVTDAILTNLEQIEVYEGLSLSSEKLSLLLKNQKLHTFMLHHEFIDDEFVVRDITNNQTLKNISIYIKEETYLKLAGHQVIMLDTFVVRIYDMPSKCLADYLATQPTKFAKQVTINYMYKLSDNNFFAGKFNERYELLENKILKLGE